MHACVLSICQQKQGDLEILMLRVCLHHLFWGKSQLACQDHLMRFMCLCTGSQRLLIKRQPTAELCGMSEA